MYRLDWTPRPAALAYERLVFHDWWTDTAGKADKAGAYQTRAFLGDYRVTATAAGRSRTVRVTLGRGGTSVAITLPE